MKAYVHLGATQDGHFGWLICFQPFNHGENARSAVGKYCNLNLFRLDAINVQIYSRSFPRFINVCFYLREFDVPWHTSWGGVQLLTSASEPILF